MDGTKPEARWQMLNASLNGIKRAIRQINGGGPLTSRMGWRSGIRSASRVSFRSGTALVPMPTERFASSWKKRPGIRPFHRVMQNGEPLPDEFVSNDKLRAMISPDPIAKAGMHIVTLF